MTGPRTVVIGGESFALTGDRRGVTITHRIKATDAINVMCIGGAAIGAVADLLRVEADERAKAAVVAGEQLELGAKP